MSTNIDYEQVESIMIDVARQKIALLPATKIQAFAIRLSLVGKTRHSMAWVKETDLEEIEQLLLDIEKELAS
ncbi:MAG: hypothetical protein EAZ74_01450 [Alphaproteobacteria bacterium]|nr:MAG: hypothetical protein EAY76_04985 [Alphaproteobacteria bacterium]TAF15589.1 MAG: hypothetical protein EAZ74_01450 [Alphaproteobacteria bacterium]TAF41993.1 MAG: hypothetical protein EAZ66_00195 [Alphaproteobacteria bacterium]TAF76601.1 MAG: hypothetical protein EAZ52_03490 [Alphaproteobacteria bacterium]